LIASYQASGGREAMLRFGPDQGPLVAVALPLFEDANRVRGFAVAICRALAARGVATILPDLPGQGESLVLLERCSILDIADGFDCATKEAWNANRRLYGVALRSGALLDKLALLNGRWHFAPQDGPSLLRDLKRIKQALQPHIRLSDTDWYFDPQTPADHPDPPVEIAGNRISTALLTDLSVYAPWTPADGGPLRIVRLDSDPAPADRHVPGAALWRRAEPGNDITLARLLADDIADWIATCER
jgi:hypothetical protein